MTAGGVSPKKAVKKKKAKKNSSNGDSDVTKQGVEDRFPGSNPPATKVSKKGKKKKQEDRLSQQLESQLGSQQTASQKTSVTKKPKKKKKKNVNQGNGTSEASRDAHEDSSIQQAEDQQGLTPQRVASEHDDGNQSMLSTQTPGGTPRKAKKKKKGGKKRMSGDKTESAVNTKRMKSSGELPTPSKNNGTLDEQEGTATVENEAEKKRPLEEAAKMQTPAKKKKKAKVSSDPPKAATLKSQVPVAAKSTEATVKPESKAEMGSVENGLGESAGTECEEVLDGEGVVDRKALKVIWRKALALKKRKRQEERRNRVEDEYGAVPKGPELSRWDVADKGAYKNGPFSYTEDRKVEEFFKDYAREHGLDIGSVQGRWSPDEVKQLQQLYENYGPKWSKIGEELNRFDRDVRAKYFDLLQNGFKGPWSEEEANLLRDCVNKYWNLTECDVTMTKIHNLPWQKISEEMGSRDRQQCMKFWYDHLCPSMVVKGEWAIEDDRTLLNAMWQSGARYEYELNWEKLVPHRDESKTRLRWILLRRCVRGHRHLFFREIVEQVAISLCPSLWESLKESPTPEAKKKYILPLYKFKKQ